MAPRRRQYRSSRDREISDVASIARPEPIESDLKEDLDPVWVARMRMRCDELERENRLLWQELVDIRREMREMHYEMARVIRAYENPRAGYMPPLRDLMPGFPEHICMACGRLDHSADRCPLRRRRVSPSLLSTEHRSDGPVESGAVHGGVGRDMGDADRNSRL